LHLDGPAYLAHRRGKVGEDREAEHADDGRDHEK
jgi:hypothetical protein